MRSGLSRFNSFWVWSRARAGLRLRRNPSGLLASAWESNATLPTKCGSSGDVFAVGNDNSGAVILHHSDPAADPVAAEIPDAGVWRFEQATGWRQLTPANPPQFRQAVLKSARCMRAHGIPVPDPGPDGQINPAAAASINQASPQFQQAQRACAHLFPSGSQIATGG